MYGVKKTFFFSQNIQGYFLKSKGIETFPQLMIKTIIVKIISEFITVFTGHKISWILIYKIYTFTTLFYLVNSVKKVNSVIYYNYF